MPGPQPVVTGSTSGDNAAARAGNRPARGGGNDRPQRRGGERGGRGRRPQGDAQAPKAEVTTAEAPAAETTGTEA